MKRKLLAALCVTAMSAGLLAGCGSSDKTEESTKTEETAKEETSSQEETETKAASSDSDNVASEEEAEKAGFSDGSDEKSDSADTDSENKDSSDSSTTSVLLDTSKELTGIHHAEIEVKDYGTIDVELDADTAPITVTNFVKLAQEGFYDGLTFPTQEGLFPWQEPVIRTAQARSSLLFRQTVHSWTAIMQDLAM